jgi:hypothetical protein
LCDEGSAPADEWFGDLRAVRGVEERLQLVPGRGTFSVKPGTGANRS